MSIEYFEDLQFVCHGEMSRSTTVKFRDDFTYWGLQFSRRGRFKLQIDRNTPEYTDDACVFVNFPQADFLYGAEDPENGIENKIFICFKGSRVQRYLCGNMLKERRNNALIRPANPDKFMRKMRLIRTLLMLPHSSENHARAVLALEQLLLEMSTVSHTAGARRDERYEAFADLTERIAAAPELKWNFEKEARRLSVSYAHFRRLFEQFFKLPPGAFLLSARLEKAAALLNGTSQPIRQIAQECGFEDEFYFSRIFKKHMKASPKIYRENHR